MIFKIAVQDLEKYELCMMKMKNALSIRGKLLYPRMVRLWVRDTLALSSLAFRVTTTDPTMVVLTTVLKISDSCVESLELSRLAC